MHVLLVENDDLDPTTSLLYSLEEGGYEVCLAHTPSSAAQKILSVWPNLIVFNPAQSLNVIDFKEALDKTELGVPCIVVGTETQNQTVPDHNLILLDPSQVQDLDQRIQEAAINQKDRFLRLPTFIVDFQKQTILRGTERFALTPKEFKLFKLLIDYTNQILKRKTIMQEVWETDYMGDTRTLDVHIRWLREKIEENPSRPKYLITVRGVGYRFSTDCN
ncbi:MAG: response regulator transcription factor [Anaerolineaceae bacterium]|nr:response regulator transcription factor [Anaerolineaceae bacterium]MCB9099575.1 response regulator transcription factor [Anaerolineales bacterium]